MLQINFVVTQKKGKMNKTKDKDDLSKRSKIHQGKTHGSQAFPHGFQRDLQPDRIVGAANSDRGLMFLMKW